MWFHQNIVILYAVMKTFFLLLILAFETCTIIILLKNTIFKAENDIDNRKMKISKSIESLTEESFKENSREADRPLIKEWEMSNESSNINVSTNTETPTEEADRYTALIKEWKLPTESSNINVSTNTETTTEEADSYTALIKEQAVTSKLLWPNSEGCSHIVVTLTKDNTYPLCGLLSSPCSGNTWIRYLIESMTGIATGSVYNSGLLTSLGFIGEAAPRKCGCTIVQKSHSFGNITNDVKMFNYQAIVLVRNPYKQVVSWTNWKLGGGKFKVTSRKFSLKEWYNISVKALGEWKTHNTEWIKTTRNGIVVHYEDLQNNMMGEMKRILQFLHIPFIKERYKCLLKEQSTKYKREKSKEQEDFLRKAYTEELHGSFDAAINEINSLLKQKDHPSIPYHLYSCYNETEMNDGQHPLIN